MDIKKFASEYDIKLNVSDSSIKSEQVINSLYNNRTIIKENDNQIQNNTDSFFEEKEINIPTNLPDNVNIIIPNDSIKKETVLKSLSENVPDLTSDLITNISQKTEQEDKQGTKINFIKELSDNIEITSVEPPRVQKMIQINKATEEELKALPGIRLVHAKKIIQLRRYNTYINSFSDFKDKIGIDEEQINQLRKYVIIDTVERKYAKFGRMLDI